MVSEKTRVRVLAIGMLCLLLLVAILMIWQFSDALFMDPPPAPVQTTPTRTHPRPAKLQRAPATKHEEPSALGQHTAAVAHERVAEALGLVAIRCFVGPGFETDGLFGNFQPRIEDGWYSNVETTLKGSHGVVQRFERETPPAGPRPLAQRYDYETIFEVSWSADAPGAVPCTVEPVRYADLTVKVVDADQAPMEAVTVFACGRSGKSDSSGHATVQVHAGTECFVSAGALSVALAAALEGHLTLPALQEDEARTVVLTMVPMDLNADPLAVLPVDRPAANLYAIPNTDAELAVEIDLFNGLAKQAEGEEAALLAKLIHHRESLISTSPRARQRQAEIEATLDSIPSGELDPDTIVHTVMDAFAN